MGQQASLEKDRDLVLVVEDDNEVRESLSVELELEGFAVLTAKNGEEALQVARSAKPDVILMDILMPVLDGIETTKTLKADEDTRYIPVIMVTVVDKREDIIKGLEVGAIDYITKPFFMPELKARVKTVCRYKKLYDDLRNIQKHLYQDVKLNTVTGLIATIRKNINKRLNIISGRTEVIRRNKGHASEKDLKSIEGVLAGIKHSVTNLGIFELFMPDISHIVSRIFHIDLAKEFRV